VVRMMDTAQSGQATTEAMRGSRQQVKVCLHEMERLPVSSRLSRHDRSVLDASSTARSTDCTEMIVCIETTCQSAGKLCEIGL
jgi:hypothetical protein